MFPFYYVVVHGVRIRIDGNTSWKSLDEAEDIADSFLRYGFHSIEVRDTFNDKLKYILTIKDKEELNARISWWMGRTRTPYKEH